MNEHEPIIAAALQAHIASDVRVVTLAEGALDGQGYSGAAVHCYDVTYTSGGETRQTSVVVKEAERAERRTLDAMQRHALSVPWSYSADLDTDAPVAVCMQDVSSTLWSSGDQKRVVARALAAIHATYLRRTDNIYWLPRADPTFIRDFTVEACWRSGWERVRAGQSFMDAYGNDNGPQIGGGDFSALDRFTAPLEAAAERFIQTMTDLWTEGSSLTLNNGDFHDGNLRFHDNKVYIIDWGQAQIGSLYLDLPNYFTRDEALLYRDALAEHGHDIPVAEFLQRYDAVRPYPGFKYFGIGLWNWCYGDPPHRDENVQHFIDMIL